MRVLLLIVGSLFISSCGIVEYSRMKDLSEAEIANLGDDKLCKEIGRFILFDSYVPARFVKEANKRDMKHCYADLYKDKE